MRGANKLMMRHITILLAILFALFAENVFAGNASFRQIKGAELFTMLNGKTELGHYNPEFYDGVLDYRETHNTDGTSDYAEDGGLKFRTKWNIIGGDKVCYKFSGAQAGMKTQCFVLYLNNGCIYSYYAPRMTINGPESWDDWLSKSVIKGSENSCTEPIS